MNTDHHQITEASCNFCGKITDHLYLTNDQFLCCKPCSAKKHRRALWDAFGEAAEIIIEINDPEWEKPDSRFEKHLIKLSQQYYPELIKVLRVDDEKQIIRLGRVRNGFSVTSYDDLVRRIRRPWRQACYDSHQRVA